MGNNKGIQKVLLAKSLEAVRKQAERCDVVLGLNTLHSITGGFGSGFGALLNEQLLEMFPKTSRFNFTLFPEQRE